MARRHRQGHHTAMTVPDDDDRIQPLLDHQLRELIALSVDGQLAGPERVQGEDAPILPEVLGLGRELEIVTGQTGEQHHAGQLSSHSALSSSSTLSSV